MRKKDTNKIYAMKVMNKKIIVEKNDTEHIKAERRILQVHIALSSHVIHRIISDHLPLSAYVILF